MACYDGAEICKLVGIYIQRKLCKLINKKDFGLYRDDGLGILRNTSGPEADRKRKSITKVFKECGLSITCEVNKKIVDFLDVRFNLNDQTYEPYRKPNNNHVYINKHSNHPRISSMKFQRLYQNVSLVFPVIKMCLTEKLQYTIQH